LAGCLPRHHQTIAPTQTPNARIAKATQPQSVLASSSVEAAAAPAAAAAPGFTPLLDVTVTVPAGVVTVAAGDVAVTVMVDVAVVD